MIIMDVQYWLLPVDENNLRCQVAGYRSLKDYLITKGLKLRKWKETGLIRELITTTGMKIQFGKYVQYSKICLPYVKLSCDQIKKDFYSDAILRTPRTTQANVRKKLPSQHSFTHQKPRQTGSAIEQHQASFSQSVMKARPHSARPASKEKPKIYPFHRSKTIYLSPKATHSNTSISKTTKDHCSESQKLQEKVKVLHSPKRTGTAQKYVPRNFTVKSTPNLKRQTLNYKNTNKQGEVGSDLKTQGKPYKQKKESNISSKNREKSSTHLDNSCQKVNFDQVNICDETSTKNTKSDHRIGVLKAEKNISASLHKIPLVDYEIGSQEIKQSNVVKNKLGLPGNKAESTKLNKYPCSPINLCSYSKQKNEVQINQDICSAGDNNIQSMKLETEINNREINENVSSTNDKVSVIDQNIKQENVKQKSCLHQSNAVTPEKELEYVNEDLQSLDCHLSDLKIENKSKYQIVRTPRSKNSISEQNLKTENALSFTNNIYPIKQEVEFEEKQEVLPDHENQVSAVEVKSETMEGNMHSCEKQINFEEDKEEKIIKEENINCFLDPGTGIEETKQVACLSDKESLNVFSEQVSEPKELKQDLCYNIRITLSEKNVEVNIQEECAIKNQTSLEECTNNNQASLEHKTQTVSNHVSYSSEDTSECKEMFSSRYLTSSFEDSINTKETDHSSRLYLRENHSSVMVYNSQFEHTEDSENIYSNSTALQEKQIQDSKISNIPKLEQQKEDNMINHVSSSERKLDTDGSVRLSNLIANSHVKYNRRSTENGFLQEKKNNHIYSYKQSYSDPSWLDSDIGSNEEIVITEMLKKGFKVIDNKCTAESQISINDIPNKGTQIIQSKNEELEMTEIVQERFKFTETTSSVAESEFSLHISPSSQSLQSKNSSTYVTGSESSFSIGEKS